MERTLQEKRDAEHFLKVLAPKYKTVIVVDLQEDTVRPLLCRTTSSPFWTPAAALSALR